MKFNKWTLGLAAVGVVSLASAAKAEEKANTVLTALSATTISGYVDTSAQWNIGTGNDRLPDYKFGGAGKADGFNLDVVQLRIEKPLDEGEWAAGYRVDLWFGPDANTLGTQSFFGSSTETGTAADFGIRQAYVSLRMPVGNGIDWKIGVFDSIVGYESVESPNNPNYTRSYGHSFEPQTHTGILASYRFCDMVSASLGIADTMGPIVNYRAFGEDGKAESSKTYMASLAFTMPDNMGFMSGSTIYGGIVSGLAENEGRADYDQNGQNYYAGVTLATPVTGLRLGAAFDLLNVAGLGGETWSLGGYASFQATEKLSFHARAEYLRDRGEQKFFLDSSGNASNPDRAMELTATAQYDLWKNVISRLEVRWDHSLSGQKTWGPTNTSESGNDPGTLKNQVMVAANIIYKF